MPLAKELEPERTSSRRRRVSKKSKRSWRKHADVKDVEEYLEGRRREEVFGAPALEKSSEDLFFVQKDISDDPGTFKCLTRRDRRLKPLKSEINLLPNPAIKGFPSQRRKATRRSRGQDISSPMKLLTGVDSSSDEEVDRSISHRTLSERYNGRLVARRREHPDKVTVHVASKDIWSEEPEVEMNDEHYLKVTRKKKVKKPVSMMEVPSLLHSVELPHPGMSYNPSFEEHQDLLRKALIVEEKKMKAAQKLERRLQLTKMTHEQRERVWQEEMSEGILGGAGGEEEEEEEEKMGEEEGEMLTKRPIRAEERKTKKQRRKEQIRRKEEMMRKIAKARKLKMDEVFRLRSIRKEITQKEDAFSKKEAQTLEMKKQSPYLTKRLGKQVFEEPAIPLQLSSEVTGSLRTLKPEGSIAMERFKSLQKRNIIEPRELVRPHRKYKLLIKEKRSAKIEEDKNF